MMDSFDRMAVYIFTTAINEGRAGELLEALFNGAMCTVDVHTGKLIIAYLPEVTE